MNRGQQHVFHVWYLTYLYAQSYISYYDTPPQPPPITHLITIMIHTYLVVLCQTKLM